MLSEKFCRQTSDPFIPVFESREAWVDDATTVPPNQLEHGAVPNLRILMTYVSQ